MGNRVLRFRTAKVISIASAKRLCAHEPPYFE
jgi:hypothetical protein